jgi:hypothetical protein
MGAVARNMPQVVGMPMGLGLGGDGEWGLSRLFFSNPCLPITSGCTYHRPFGDPIDTQIPGAVFRPACLSFTCCRTNFVH